MRKKYKIIIFALLFIFLLLSSIMIFSILSGGFAESSIFQPLQVISQKAFENIIKPIILNFSSSQDKRQFKIADEARNIVKSYKDKEIDIDKMNKEFNDKIKDYLKKEFPGQKIEFQGCFRIIEENIIEVNFQIKELLEESCGTFYFDRNGSNTGPVVVPEALTIAQAESSVPYSVAKPTYLPKGFKFKAAYIESPPPSLYEPKDETIIPPIILWYSSNHGQILICELGFASEGEIQKIPGEKILINGMEGSLITGLNEECGPYIPNEVIIKNKIVFPCKYYGKWEVSGKNLGPGMKKKPDYAILEVKGDISVSEIKKVAESIKQ